jgi:hypothetical protein
MTPQANRGLRGAELKKRGRQQAPFIPAGFSSGARQCSGIGAGKAPNSGEIGYRLGTAFASGVERADGHLVIVFLGS